MARSAHAGFNPSQLVRCLADLDIPEVAASKQTVAERLSPWLGWADAISLASLLNGAPASVAAATAPAPPTAVAPDRATPAAQAATLDLHRVRTELALSIAQQTWHNAEPTGDAVVPTDWRRRYLAQQQAMEARITPLRARIRAAVASASPVLSRLAALDAVLESALAARERQLLHSVPGMLDQHRRGARLAASPAQSAAAFGATVQAVLLAELTLRLQPVEGLLAALGTDTVEPT